jgi:hypothetical protein
VNHFATPEFWFHYRQLPAEIRDLADKNFQLLRGDPKYPSLQFKKIGSLWSARVGQHYRALGLHADDGVHWFWIGTHAEYDQLLRAR